jgi:8-amino-7-oxononanoate synthase
MKSGGGLAAWAEQSWTIERYAERRHALAGRALLQDFNPFFVDIDRLKHETSAKGLEFLSFAEYDYLAIAKDDKIRNAACEAIMRHGLGAGASRLVGGERSVHRALEQTLARFIGTEDALTLVSGYGTNVSLVGHLLTTGDLILVDEYAHNSIALGARLSRAETRTFRHNDIADLKSILANVRQNYRRVLVVVEGLYSMEGDIPDLPRLLNVCESYAAWLMIDEAHSIGVLGATGRGICEHFKIEPNRVDLIVGTLSKAFANCGGFICAKAAVIDWLRYSLSGFIYSVGLPPHIAIAVGEAIDVIENDPSRISRLHEISAYFVKEAARLGFDTGSAEGIGVVPIKFATAEATMSASAALMEAGIYVPPIFQIGVPKDMPRLRFFITAAHTKLDVDRMFGALVRWRECRSDSTGRAAPVAAE